MTEAEQAPNLSLPKAGVIVVSNRAYRKKDYDYISGFNQTIQSGRIPCKTNVDPQYHIFNKDSDFSVTQSSLESGISPSFESSTSFTSVESCTKTSMDSIEAENQHPESHYLVSPSDSLQMLQKQPGEVHVPMKEEDLYGCEKNTTEGDNEVARLEMIKKQPTTVPPKFGDWNSDYPSSGDGYTYIFDKLRDEKILGVADVSPPSTYPRIGLSESYSVENTQHEPDHHPIKAQESKSNKAKFHSSQQRKSSKWSFCCTATSVVD